MTFGGDRNQDAAAIFLRYSSHKLMKQYWPRMHRCVEGLTDEQVWWRPNDASNSIGNLLLHLEGNARQWLIDTFEKQNSHRDRSSEFSQKDGAPRQELLAKLAATLGRVENLLARITPDELCAVYEIQGYEVSGLEAVYHVIEHFSMHYGQVLYITKILQNEDLGFYRSLGATGFATGEEDSLA